MRLHSALIVASVGLQKHSALSNPTNSTAAIMISSCFIYLQLSIIPRLGSMFAEEVGDIGILAKDNLI